MPDTIDLDALRAWIGRTEERADVVTLAPVAALAATMDRPAAARPGLELPPLWHWLYFLPRASQADLGDDGHPGLGGFMPPVPLPRRMWAGGRLTFEQPLHVGDDITRSSEITDVAAKQGKRGALVFVTVRHRVARGGRLAIVEDHDIVYRDTVVRDSVARGIVERDVVAREAPPPAPTQPAPAATTATVLAPTDSTFARTVTPDPVLLFRYSALTFNAHRIHYDRRYASEVEGYPGLIVHGPLLATLLLDLLNRQHPDARVRNFSFQAISPVFDGHDFAVCGKPDGDRSFALWVQGPAGELCMRAKAELA